MKWYYYTLYIEGHGHNLYKSAVPKSRWAMKTDVLCITCCHYPRLNGVVEAAGGLLYQRPIKEFRRIRESDLFIDEL